MTKDVSNSTETQHHATSPSVKFLAATKDIEAYEEISVEEVNDLHPSIHPSLPPSLLPLYLTPILISIFAGADVHRWFRCCWQAASLRPNAGLQYFIRKSWMKY